MDVRDPATRDAAVKVPTSELADGEELVDTELRGRGADLAVVRRPGAAELGHVAEDGDAAPVARPLGEIREGGSHGDGVGVIRVVDQKAAACELLLLPAPAREIDVDGLGAREAERVERGERGRRVLNLMLRGEVEAHTADDRSPTDAGRLRWPDPNDLDIVAGDRKVVGDDCRAARWEGGYQLTLRPCDTGERIHELEMNGADVRDDADLGPGELGELGDLAEAAHRQLQDADLGVLFEAAESERHADLVVEAGLCRDRVRRRTGQRGEDVLRRRLPHRARDGDDARRAALAHGSRDASKSREGIVGNERRHGATGQCVFHELRASVHGDKEIAGRDAT